MVVYQCQKRLFRIYKKFKGLENNADTKCSAVSVSFIPFKSDLGFLIIFYLLLINFSLTQLFEKVRKYRRMLIKLII